MRKPKLDRDGRDWHVSYQKDDGFVLHVNETSRLGEYAQRLLLLLDQDRLGFCWINPWSWTWKAGVDTLTVTWTRINPDSTDLSDESQDFTNTVRLETANLGSLWMRLGQRLCNFTDSLARSREVLKVPLTNEQVREHFPTTWADLSFLVEDVDEEGAAP